MRNLYFQRSNGNHLLLQENVETVEEALKLIGEFLDRHNYTSHYTRIIGDEVVTFDVGSWSEFFILAAADKIAVVEGTEKDFIERK